MEEREKDEVEESKARHASAETVGYRWAARRGTRKAMDEVNSGGVDGQVRGGGESDEQVRGGVSGVDRKGLG